MKKTLLLFITVVVLLLTGLTSVQAATLNVPGTYATIQAAINAAADGDVIEIAAGTYNEALSVGKSLTFHGAGPSTIITSTASPIIQLSVTGKDFSFQNLIIEGNVTNIGIRAGSTIDINSFTMQNVIARNCQVAVYFSENWPGADALAATVNTFLLDNVTLTNNTYIGAYIGKTVVSGTVINSTITHNGFSDAGSADWQKVGLQFVDFFGGTAPRVTVTNTTFNDNGAGASSIERTGLSFYTALNSHSANELLTVTGCTLTNHPLWAVRIKNGSNVGNTSTVNGTFTNNNLDIWFNNVAGTTTSTTLVRNSSTGIKTVGAGPTYAYATIQDAINAATAGDIIQVAAGTYIEPVQLDITKNITLLGASAGTTIIKPGFSTAGSGNVKLESFIYIAPGATVVMKNFTVDCSGQQVNHAIQSRGALDIEDCIIQNVKFSENAGRGIVFYAGTTGNLVKNVTFNHIERIGVHVRGGVLTPAPVVNIQNMTYLGKGIGTSLDYAVEFGAGGGGNIDHLIASNCLGVASDGSTSAAVMATTYFGTGTYANITNSLFTDNSTAIVVGYNAADVSTVTAHHNSFLGTGATNGIQTTGPAVNAGDNYWGSVIGSGIQPKISGNVDFSPWYNADFTTAYPIPITTIGTPVMTICGLYDVPVTVANFNGVGNISITLNYDKDVLEYKSVTPNTLIPELLGPAGVVTPGTFKMSKVVSPGITLTDGSVLFTLHFALKPTISGIPTVLTWDAAADANEYSSPEGTVFISSPFATYFIPGSMTVPVRPVINTTTHLEYCTIQAAITAAEAGNTITVAAGNYYEDILIEKSITLNGNNAGISGCSRTSNPETIIYPKTNDGNPTSATGMPIIYVKANNVTIDGFTIDGHSGAASTYEVEGVTVNAIEGVGAWDGVANLEIKNNIIQNLTDRGIDIYNYTNAGAMTSGNKVHHNKFFNINPKGLYSGAGAGVLVYNNAYTDITDNCMDQVRKGIQTGNFSQANAGNVRPVFANNSIKSYKIGIWHNAAYGATSTFDINNNLLQNTLGSTVNSGIEISSVQGTTAVSVANNTVTGAMAGINLWGNTTISPLAIGANTFIDCSYGVFANNFDGYDSNAGSSSYIINGGTITNPLLAGVYVKDNPLNTNGATVAVNVAGTSISGTAAGMKAFLVDGAGASLSFSGASPQATVSGAPKYIVLQSNGIDVPNGNIDATAVSFDGKLGSAMSNAELFATEDKINHKIDLSTLGFVSVKANNAFVTNIALATASNNDYTRIKNAVELVANTWTINLKGTFNWAEANASASWALGNDGLATTADNWAVYVPANLNGVTFTAPEGLGTAKITGPGDLPNANLEGVLAFDGGDNKNWTISNLEFLEFDMPIYMGNGAGGSDAFEGTIITNNKFNIAKDLNVTVAPIDVNQNIGIHFSHGANQTISNNTFNVPGDGISNGTNYSTIVVMQSNTSGGGVYDGLKIKDNTINVTGVPASDPAVIRGIWENGANSDAAIEISGNKFLNSDAGNTANLNRQTAFWITSVSNATKKVEYKNNEISGFNEGIAWIGGLYTSYGSPAYLTGQFPVEISNNKFDGLKNAVVVRKAVASNNTGSPALIQNNSFPNFVSGGLAIKNEGTGDAQSLCNWYGSTLASVITSLNSGPVYMPSFLSDGTDGNVATGFQPSVTCTTSPVQNTTRSTYFTTIQGAIDATTTQNGDVIEVAAGVYAENVIVNKSLTILGPNALINPITGTRSLEAFIVPAANNPTTGFVVNVTAPDVTIKGFTVDGDNPLISGGQSVNGIDVNADAGINNGDWISPNPTFDGYPGMVLENNIIRNVVDVAINMSGKASMHGGPIQANLIDNSGWWGITITDNYYADVLDNKVTRCFAGIQTNNFYLGGTAASISRNEVHYYKRGIFYNMNYGSSTPFTISANKLTIDQSDGNVIADNNAGMYIVSQALTTPATITGNIINAGTGKWGIQVWNCVPGAIKVTGGSITGGEIGAYITSNSHNTAWGVANTSAIIDNVLISNSTVAGVKVFADPAYTNTAFAELKTLSISGVPSAILVTGKNAGANIHNNTINATAIGISVDGPETSATSLLSIQNNTVTLAAQLAGSNPTVGIALTNISGTDAAAISGNNIASSFYGYMVYNLNTAPATTITGGAITGVMQGIIALNVNPATGVSFAPSTFNLSGQTMSGFTGSSVNTANNFHAGVYVFTTGSNAIDVITATVDKVSVSGTGNIQGDCAGLSFADFSTGAGTRQNITVTECTLTDNLNRGVNVRGTNALVNIGTSTLTGNGFDPFGSGGNDGFGIVARVNALVNVHNCFIINPAGTSKPVTAISNDGATITAVGNHLDNNNNTAMGKLVASSGIPMTATCNWLGSTNPATNAAMIAGPVSYNPWLCSGVDQAPATTGFQGVACNSGAPVVPVAGVGTVSGIASATEPTLPSVKDVDGTTDLTPVFVSMVDSPVSVVCEGTRTYTYSYTNCSGFSTNWSYTYTVTKSTLSGTLKYNNNNGIKTPMNNVTLTLMPGGLTSITNEAGFYSFPGLCPDEYTISVTNNAKPVGGINSTDAGAALYWFSHTSPIEHVKFLAGDVTKDLFVNATDAQLIQKYFVFKEGITNPWSYAKKGEVVSANPGPDASFAATVAGNVPNYDIYAMCTGDFNGSFMPDATKSTYSSLELIAGNNVQMGTNQVFELPLRSTSAVEVGAVSMILDIPSDLVEVLGVRVNGSNVPVTYAVKGNELRIGWNSTTPVNIAENGNLLTLQLKTKGAFTAANTIDLKLIQNPLNEMADGNFNVIDGAVLTVDQVKNGLSGIYEPGVNNLSLSNYPNPFSESTMVAYEIPAGGTVVLEVHNMLGQLMTTLVDKPQDAGKYSVKLEGSMLQKGIFFVILKLNTIDGELTRTIRLIVN